MSGDCTHIFPERDVGCKTCEDYFAQERVYETAEQRRHRNAAELRAWINEGCSLVDTPYRAFAEMILTLDRETHYLRESPAIAPHGCMCPPHCEITCQGPMCPRKALSI